MGVKQSVFGSAKERESYYKLGRQWGDKYRVCHNLPFLMVFNTKSLVDLTQWPRKPAQAIELSDIDIARLKKTSIDFTLCDEHDAPLICIDFDGMCEGFNVGTSYHAPNESNLWREMITSLKLKVAHGSQFPYFVVGSRFFDDLSPNLRLTIVDGIIGDVLAGRAVQQRASDGFSPEDAGWTVDEFDKLLPSEQDEIIQNWFIGVEVESDFANNPIYIAKYELWKELSRLLGSVRCCNRFRTLPDYSHARTVRERVSLIDDARLLGSECSVETEQYGTTVRTVWLPNFKTPGFGGLSSLDEIAQLVALDAVKRQHESHAKTKRPTPKQGSEPS